MPSSRANRVLVVGLTAGITADISESLAQERTEGFGNPMFTFGKVLNALLLSPIDTDLARLRFINKIIEDGERAFGADFLEKLHAASTDSDSKPLERIHDLAIRPTQDLGIVAGCKIARL